MGLLARLLAPENAALKIERDHWKAVAHVTEQRLFDEIERNRVREDLLVTSALHAAGLPGVPTRDVIDQPPEDPNEAARLDEETEKILDARADEIAAAKYGDEFTDEQRAEVLREIRKNPAYYASN